MWSKAEPRLNGRSVGRSWAVVQVRVNPAHPQTPHSPPRSLHDQIRGVFAQDVRKPRLGLLAEVGGVFRLADLPALIACTPPQSLPRVSPW